MESLSKYFPALTQAAFGKRGFAQADVISHWAEIVGADMARWCAPERIKWPREGGAGTLVLRAAAGRSLDVEYQTQHIMGRINQFFGYKAVTAVKVVAGHAVKAVAQKKLQLQPDKVLPRLSGIEDETLKSALAQLGAAVISRSPQVK